MTKICLKINNSFSGKNVHLSFVTFEMEDEQDCGYDFIEVFSGFDDTGPSYGRFCGNKVGHEILEHLWGLNTCVRHAFPWDEKLCHGAL